jgi:hypothetical protein
MGQLFSSILKKGALLIGAIAAVGGVFGYLVASTNGLVSALIGATMAFVFVSMTALSVWIGGKLSLGGFFGVVLGGWLVKLVGFMVLVASLRTADFIVGPVLFGSLVVSILGSLALDAIVFSKARIPSFESK